MAKEKKESKEEQAPNARRPYDKPVGRLIPLVADEVLGVGCKFAGGTGQLGDCHLGTGCPTDGS